jgi:hypothetical protein
MENGTLLAGFPNYTQAVQDLQALDKFVNGLNDNCKASKNDTPSPTPSNSTSKPASKPSAKKEVKKTADKSKARVLY